MASEQSFMKAAFFGVVAEELIFPYPQLSASERDETHGLAASVRRLGERVDSAAIDKDRRIPDDVMASMRELSLFGLGIPKEYGGLGLKAASVARVVQELAMIDASLALTVLTHEAIGTRGILLFGSDEQKQTHLPRLARGEQLAAFALTEHASGTDAGTIRTHAAWDAERKVYLLSGEKPWVTNGDRAELITVFARTNRPDEGQKPQLTAFLVPRGPGVHVGKPLDTLGIRGAGVVPLRFDNVVLPPSAVLGEPRKGFRVAMQVLSDARLELSASMLGQARSVLDRVLAYIQERRSFGRAIAEFPIVKDKIAKMMADSYAIESMIYLTAGLMDRGVEDTSLESAICRVASVEALWRVVNEAMQVFAGKGYVASEQLERRLRDARSGFVLDGTNETLRCFIALSGLRGPGERLEMDSVVAEPIKGFGLLRRFAPRRVREALRRERVTRAHPSLDREAVIFEEAAQELGEASLRALRAHGREIAEMQYTQKRLANVAIDLYALGACLSRTTAAISRVGEGGAQREVDLTTMFGRAAGARMRAHLSRLEHNDDELRKAIAARAYADRGYPFDVI